MKYLIFGTGDYYERYKKWFDRGDVLALLDNSPAKQDTYIDGIKVLSPESGICLAYDVIVILSFYVKAMKRQLTGLGVPEQKIYHFYDLHKLICSGKGGQGVKYKRPVEYYGGADRIDKSSCILLLSHDLTLGGPSLALYQMARVFKGQGIWVVFASMLDGPLREVLLLEGIPVVVDVNLQIETMREAEWTEGFSQIICNTINFYVFLSDRDTQLPVVWWLHDSSFFYDGVDKKILCELNQENMRIYAVGPVARGAAAIFLSGTEIGNLLYGVADESACQVPNRNKIDSNGRKKLCFVTIGYIEARKGQDILVRAIMELPEKIREKAEFYLVGQDSSWMAEQLRDAVRGIPEVILTGTMDRKGINMLLDRADVMICPQRT